MVKLLRHIPTKFGLKFPSSFQSLPFDWQLRIEIPNFEANLWNLQRTSQIACQKFCEVHCKQHLLHQVHKRNESLKQEWNSHQLRAKLSQY